MNYLETVKQNPLLLGDLAEAGIFLSEDHEGNMTMSAHLNGEIGDPEEYQKFMELSRCLMHGDSLEIIMSGNPGGQLAAARAITTAMDACPAHITVVGIDNIASACTKIAMHADDLVMTPGSSMMIHTAAYGYGGIAPNVKTAVDFIDGDIKRFIRESYKTFLTKKEIADVVRGDEKWLLAEDCMERFAKLKKKRDKQMAREEKVMLKGQREVLAAQLEALDDVIAG